jgi:uncharacterized protein YbaR (Trm112 family)
MRGLPVAQIARELAGDARSYLRERSLHSPRPPKAGLVLDVGGGDRPNPRADLVVDKYVADNFERETDIAFTKPLVVADGEALPFADQAFDYLIASHVLEHAIDPRRMAGEFNRVAAAGFVQMPTAAAERIYGWSFHPWLVNRSGDTLVFRPKDLPPRDTAMHDAYDESLLVRLGWAAHRSRWHHSVHWSGELRVEVSAPAALDHDHAELDVERTVALLENARAVPLDARLRNLLRCPIGDCRGSLRFEGSAAVCEGCGTRYGVPGGVPVLLVP